MRKDVYQCDLCSKPALAESLGGVSLGSTTKILPYTDGVFGQCTSHICRPCVEAVRMACIFKPMPVK